VRTPIVTEAFRASLINSIYVAVIVAVISFFTGSLLGVLASIYSFRFRGSLLALHTMPLLLPSHLLAIAWSSIAIRLGFSEWLSGSVGCVVVFSSIGIPLVVLTTLASCRSLSESQIDAARLAGGERAVFASVVQYAFYPALVAATLTAVLTLSDPGPGQIFSLPVAASEILTSFAAFFDFAGAGRQCLILSLITLSVVTPILFVAAKPLANEVLVKQTRPARTRWLTGPSTLTTTLMFVIVAGQLLFPLTGLILPALSGAQFARAWNEVLRTVYDTGVYAAAAAVASTFLGFALAFFSGRSERTRRWSLASALALLALPPSLAALGLIALAAGAPAWMDPLLRSRLTVGLALGLRFFPISALVALRAWAALPASWNMVAALHGVSLWRYVRKVVIPYLIPSLVMSLLVASLMAGSDIVTTLLLHPPGESSLPLSIFTIMANAPESIVATLCLLYVGGAAVLLGSLWWVAGKA
jgi:iron(III) transport system permease protein